MSEDKNRPCSTESAEDKRWYGGTRQISQNILNEIKYYCSKKIRIFLATRLNYNLHTTEDNSQTDKLIVSISISFLNMITYSQSGLPHLYMQNWQN
jgi:hypothetical protein